MQKLSTVLVLGCLGLAGCATAQSQNPYEPYEPQVMTPARKMQKPLPPEDVRAPVQSTVQLAQYEPDTIIISTRERVLYYIDQSGKTTSYRIGVGRAGFEWSGRAYVAVKKEWPDWTPPKAMLARQPHLPRHMQGGLENPLGARALYLFDAKQRDKDTQYRIHGTNDPSSIGQNVSSGCIRLFNPDIIDLYRRVGVGTKVVVM